MSGARSTIRTVKASASTILVAKTNFSPNRDNRVKPDYNYKILTLQRSAKSDFFPETHVFPGGNVAKVDASRDWLKLYKRFGFTFEILEKLNPKNNLPPILIDNDSSVIPKYISLRITAIRETFEECGILICRNCKTSYKEGLTHWANYLTTEDIIKWREKVIQDPLQFYYLCSEFEMYPDIWSLKDWSNWTTPTTATTKRFDTIFFLAAFRQMPPTSIDDREIQKIQWATPSEYIDLKNAKSIILLPPQFYEISRLQNFFDISSLLKFAIDRKAYGMERYLPHKIITDKAIYTILPGDDLYPDETTLEKEDMLYLKDIPESTIQNRIKIISPYETEIITKNFTPLYNHIKPMFCKL